MFPPSLLLIELFRRTKRRQTRISKIKQILTDNKLFDNLIEKRGKIHLGIKKRLTNLKFPWWSKIFAYLLSFAFATVSIFFVIVKGIEFGNDKVQNWLTSLLTSFLSSVLLTQPLQVLKFLLEIFKLIFFFKNTFFRLAYLSCSLLLCSEMTTIQMK